MIFEFGTKLNGVDYSDRPGAYAVLTNDQMQVAVIRTSHGHFLPGGGIDAAETPVEALKREILEEIGWQVSGLNVIGEAVEYIKARTDGEYYRIHSTFFRAQWGVSVGDGVEEDHQLIWLSREEVAKLLTRQSQVWAIQSV
jgi:8-oxo-dGTP diphosphatase